MDKKTEKLLRILIWLGIIFISIKLFSMLLVLIAAFFPNILPVF